MGKEKLQFLQASQLVAQTESPHELSPMTSNGRVQVRARSIMFVNWGTDVVFVNFVPVAPNGGIRVLSASWNGILWQDIQVQFEGGVDKTQLLYITEVNDVGKTTNY